MGANWAGGKRVEWVGALLRMLLYGPAAVSSAMGRVACSACNVNVNRLEHLPRKRQHI